MSDWTECRDCRGTGVCQSCMGRGIDNKYNPHPQPHMVDKDTGYSTCHECNGNGKCSECNGRGKI